jgi:two-component system, cell cycle sensor histidine kinase and response regulator CckA
MNILIVDDHATPRKLLRTQLEAEGHGVVEAADGVEALQVLESKPQDAVVSDILMPNMDGFRLCLEVRKQPRFNAIPVILYTSTFDSPSDRLLAETVGADGYIVKPASVATILEALREAAQPGASQRGGREAGGDASSVLKQYNESLVAKLEERNIELAAHNEALRQTEEELRLMHEKLRHLLAHSPAVIYTLKLRGQNVVPVVVSDNIERLLGINAAESASYDWWRESLHPEDRDRVLATFAEGLTNGGYSGEYRIRHKDGTYRWVEDNNRVILDASGQPRQTVGVWTDITERREAEEAMRESEHKHRHLFESLSDAAFLVDAESGLVLETNHQAEVLFDLTRGQIIGMNLSQFHRIGTPEDHRQRLAAYVANAAPTNYETEFVRKDKIVVPVHVSSVPITLHGQKLILALLRDITERKQSEQCLSTHNAVTLVLARSDTLIEAAKIILQIICQKLQWDLGGLWTVDRTTKRLICVEICHPPSTEFNQFVSLSRQKTFASGEGLPGRVWETGRPAWISELAQDSHVSRKDLAVRIGLRSAVAFPIKLRDEILGVIEFFSAQVRSADNELLAMFTTVGSQIGQFIERKQLEEQFRQAQKMEAFGQLAGGVAHDFNNILAVMMGYTSLLLENEDLKAGVKEELMQVYSAGERAANLTRQLLTFSRKKEIDVSPLDLNGVIGNMTKMLGRVIGEDIKLKASFSPNLPTTEADEGMIEQVLMNLAVNARDAMPKGGGLIIGTDRVVADAAFVQSNPAAYAGEFACLSVQDTGCGMTPEVKARIFEPFFTTKGVGKGTGLGLATVFGIVKQHQGWIEVESQVGVGTAFKVFLPAIPRSLAVPAEAAATTDVRGGHETVLLVEDEGTLRELTKLVLQRLGYRVLEAASGVEALSVWVENKGRIDLLLTDMVMPEGLTGRELAKQLRAQQPALKVIYVSGYSLDATGTAIRRQDASTFLQKPYHPRKLAQTIRQCLDQKGERTEPRSVKPVMRLAGSRI